MATYEVETDLIIHTKIKVMIEASNKEDAIDAVASILPANHDLSRQRGWKAKVDLVTPKGIDARFVKTIHFEQASGGDKARKINA